MKKKNLDSFILGTGFGAVSPTGYGINYMAGPKMIKFGIESKVSCSETGSKKFVETLTQVLLDMKDVVSKSHLNQSKL